MHRILYYSSFGIDSQIVAHGSMFREASMTACLVLFLSQLHRCLPGTIKTCPETAVRSSFYIAVAQSLQQANMDRASQVLAEGLPPGMPKSYRALADHGNVPHTTLHHRACGRRSIEEKAQSQQYLTPFEEKAVVEFLLQMSNLGQPVRIKYIPSIAFSATRQRPIHNRPLKRPGKNWAKGLENRHPQLRAKRVKALDWNRHDINTFAKMTRWFKVIEEVLKDPAILAENIYNMDETGVMLSMLGSIKVLVGKDDTRGYRGARVKRTMVTAIECISADGRYLKPMIIWPATTHRSNWTTFPTPGWQYACNESGYTDSKISLEWLKRIFDP